MEKFCQSCGTPMKQDPTACGSEIDGSRSPKFFSLCYEDDTFLGPDMAIAEMQQLGINSLREKEFPRPIGWLLTRNIPKLERWR